MILSARISDIFPRPRNVSRGIHCSVSIAVGKLSSFFIIFHSSRADPERLMSLF